MYGKFLFKSTPREFPRACIVNPSGFTVGIMYSVASSMSRFASASPPVFAPSHTRLATSTVITRPLGSSPCMFATNPNRKRPAPENDAYGSFLPSTALPSSSPRAVVDDDVEPTSSARTSTPLALAPMEATRDTPAHAPRASASSEA